MKDLVLALGATLRLTRLVTTDDLGLWLVRKPAVDWARSHEPPLPDFDGISEQDEKPPGWRLHLVSGLDCPFCVGFWIGTGVLATEAMCSRSAVARRLWRFGAATLALNYVVGHASARLDG